MRFTYLSYVWDESGLYMYNGDTGDLLLATIPRLSPSIQSQDDRECEKKGP
jgi:hypothetical protein